MAECEPPTQLPKKLVEGNPRRATPDVTPQPWDSGAARPATPAAAVFQQHDGVSSGNASRHATPTPPLPGRPHSHHVQHAAAQQQRAAGSATAGSTTISASPPAKPGGGLFKGIRTGSGSLTGLLKRPGSAAAVQQAGAGSAASPLFELRGASILPPEAARPATAAAGPTPPRTAASQQQQQHKVTPPVYNIQARSGATAAGLGVGSPTPHARATPPLPPSRQPAVVAAHGLDLGNSPAPTPAPVMQRRPDATAVDTMGTSSAASVERKEGGAAHSSHRYGATYMMPASLAEQRSASQAGGTSDAGGPDSSMRTTTVHQNPLYAGSSGSYAGGSRQRQLGLTPVRVPAPGAGAAASLPPTPLTSASPASGVSTAAAAASTPGMSPHANLQAASNLTLVSDSRPISPGPFLSTLPSGALPDSASRPVSPQCMESTPPTPGSFAPPTCGAAGMAPGAAAVRILSPIKTVPTAVVTQSAAAAAAATLQSRSVPGSPASVAMPVGSPSAVGLATGGAAAAAAAASFRLPIFNQDGRVVGYKQNSNLIPRAGACFSSAPSSPSRSAHSGDTSQPASASSAEGCFPLAAVSSVKVPSPCDSSDFREFALDPFKGFPDADNMVPGYVLGPVLGKGGFCSVRKALHALTGQAVACKIIEKGKLKDPKDRDRVDRECRVMRNLSNHCTIIKMFECVETRDYVYIMMEAAQRGSLLDYVRDKKKLPEEEAVIIFQQLLHSLQFCHRKDVVHRDIKLENILIDCAGHMKLIDFGLCGYYVAGKRLRCHCGSPSYAAPEIVARKDYLGPPVDVWSLGIVLFAMLAGYLPFHAKEKKHLSEKILAGVYKPAAWMSTEAQDLISRMLTLDPDRRITLEGVWDHPWVAAAPRWEPPGVGSGCLYRSLTDPTTGAVVPDEAVMAQLEVLGADTAAIRRALRTRECNSLTATYHLMFEAHQDAQRQAAAVALERQAAERRAAAAAKQTAAALSATSDWQWDFGAITAVAAAAAADDSGGAAPGGSTGGGGSMVGSHASSGSSSSVRTSGSPVRPRTAAGPVGSPTRFGQEAAAAGYMMSARRGTWAPQFPAETSTMPHQHQGQESGERGTSTPHQGTSPRQQAASAGAACHQADREAFTIKALRPTFGAAAAGFNGTAPAPVAGPAAATVHVAELPAVPIITAAAAVFTGGAAISVEHASPTKSPRLSSLPTVLSPKALQLGGSSAEHSPVPQVA